MYTCGLIFVLCFTYSYLSVTCAALLCCDEIHQPGPNAAGCPHAPSTHKFSQFHGCSSGILAWPTGKKILYFLCGVCAQTSLYTVHWYINRLKTKLRLLYLTLSNPIFLPPAYPPALIYFGRERGWWITCNYPTVLKEKNRKCTTCAFCWLKFVLHEEKHREQENHNVGRGPT
jgi:hypothetical protein